MSLAVINSQYNGLNGLCTGGSYGLGFAGSIYSSTNTEAIKENIANSYEIGATSNSYANKSQVSENSFKQQCDTINWLLQSGRTEEAMKKYDELYNDMADNSYYQGYNNNQIKTLLQNEYYKATGGTTIISDAETYGHTSFETSFTTSLPIVGLLFDHTSKDDLISEVTNTGKSKSAKLGSAAGVISGVGTGVGTGAAIGGIVGGVPGAIVGGIIGGVASIGTWLLGKTK